MPHLLQERKQLVSVSSQRLTGARRVPCMWGTCLVRYSVPTPYWRVRTRRSRPAVVACLEPEEDARPNLVAAGVEEAKRHPIVVVAASVVGLLLFLTTVGDAYVRATGTTMLTVAEECAARTSA